MYYTVIKHSGHLRTLDKCRKHLAAARVFYISLLFSIVFYHSDHCVLSQCNAPINVKSAGGRQGIGRGFDRSLWPGGSAFELSCCPRSRDIWIFVRAHDHKSFPGVGNFSIFDLMFFPGGREFDSNFWENVKIPPYTPPPPCRLDIDRCIIHGLGFFICFKI